VSASLQRPVAWPVALAVPIGIGAVLHGRTGLLEVVAALLLALVVILALLAGRWPALLSAISSGLVLNYWFTEPVGTLRVAHAPDVIVLILFAMMAVAVSTILDHVVRREVARVQGPAEAGDRLLVGDLVIDFDRHQVHKRGEPIALTPTEWAFLALLARNADRLVPRDVILKEVWGPAYEKETHYLRVYVGQLRRKLEDDPGQPRYIITTSGVGYTLVR